MSNQIRIVLTLDGKQFSVDLDRATGKTKAAGQEMERAGTRASALSAALRAAGVSLAGFGAVQAIKQISQTGIAFEQMRLALTSVSAGSAEAAQRFAFVGREAERLGIDVETAVMGYTRLAAATRGTNLEGEQTAMIFSAVAEASARLSLSTADAAGVMRALAQIASKGTLSAEELRQQLGDRLPGAFQIAANAMGVTTAELNEMLQAGQIASEDFLPRFAVEMRRTFGTDASTRIDTTQASFSRLVTQIKLMADSIASDLNPALAGAADLVARALASARQARDLTPERMAGMTDAELAAAGFSRRGGPLDRGIDAPFTQPGQGLVARLAGQFGGPLPFTSAPEFYGARLPPPELTKKQREHIQDLEEELALLGMQSEEEQALWLIQEGRYKTATEREKELLLLVGQRRDELKAQAEAEREAERAAQKEERRAEAARQTIQDEQLRLGIMQEELRLGRSLTGAEQELYALRHGAYEEMLPAEREKLRLILEQIQAIERLGVVVEREGRAWNEWNDYVSFVEDRFGAWVDFGIARIEDLSDAIAEAALTGQMDFHRFVEAAIYDLVRLQVQRAITLGVDAVIGASVGNIGGGIPGENLGGGTAVAAGQHAGGIVGREATFLRRVPIAAFDGAPRFHSGGMIGRDEVPIIAKKGEGVFTAAQMKALGGGANVHIEIVNQVQGVEVVPGERRRSGDVDVQQLVIRAVKRGFSDGSFDTEMRGFGARRAGRGT